VTAELVTDEPGEKKILAGRIRGEERRAQCFRKA
jgi:hypothetical protein